MNSAELKELTDEVVVALGAATDDDAVEALRIKYLGRKGILPALMKGMKDVDPSERAAMGIAANELKNAVTDGVAKRKDELAAMNDSEEVSSGFDCSLPGRWHGLGSMHPITMVIEEAIRIFGKLGFVVAEGPDVETHYNNFEALNTPPHHPSQDERDTFWLHTGELLRTQTSPVQIRTMNEQKPPVRIITPGRCYRRDTTDATHSANFHQIEGLYIEAERKVSLADLKSTMAYFAKEMMGDNVEVRFRPHFFPFTEPSVECDFTCHVCGGDGCRVCKQSGWIEIAGAGMVDPRVLERVGYDPETTTGFAFGMGIERIAMIKYGINDIRHLYENDMRFLAQF
ncbi:MAG: phenylalanine--tRNA ligase subunit alpha [Kiritimatiellae bacterium]|nr:phenylalanine--tRNA ligase subunit alpha [Kiritimatiellia bacterium]